MNKISAWFKALWTREQGSRFLRLFGAALGAQAVALEGGHLGRDVLVSGVVAAAESAYRAWRPAITVSPAVAAVVAKVEPAVAPLVAKVVDAAKGDIPPSPGV